MYLSLGIQIVTDILLTISLRKRRFRADCKIKRDINSSLSCLCSVNQGPDHPKMNSSDITTSRHGCYKKYMGKEMRTYILILEIKG